MKITVTYRRKRSGISMRVTPGGNVNVSAPLGTPKSLIEKFIRDHSLWISQALQRVSHVEQQRSAFYDRLPLSTPAQKNMARQQLKRIVAPMLQKYTAMLDTEVRQVTFMTARTRWGSCNHRLRKINLSLYLLLLPERCIEHVVAHECAHLRVPNHGAPFYALMDRIYPLWREARAETARLSSNA